MAVNWQVKHHHHATVCGRMFSTIGSTSSEFHDIKREDLTVYPPYCKQQKFFNSHDCTHRAYLNPVD